LHLLAENGSCKAIMAILTHVEKHHLDKLEEVINIKDNRGQTLLHIAAYNEKLDVVEYLISKDAYFNVKDKLNGTPLHSAAEGGNYKVVKAVLAHIEKKHSGGLSKVINAKTNNGATPLHLAAYNGKLSVVEPLINKGVNIDAKGRNGQTPLFYAVQGGI
jgi:ankyrin repeat protein